MSANYASNIGEICTSIFRDRAFCIQYNHNNDRTDKRLEYSGIYARNIDFGFSTKQGQNIIHVGGLRARCSHKELP